MKRAFFFAILSGCLLSVAPAHAKSGDAPQDIVVIDSMQIMQMTQRGREISAKVDKCREDAEKELIEQQQEFMMAQKQFEEKRVAMSEQAIREEERRLARLERELKNRAQDMQSEFQEKVQMAMTELSRDLREIVSELAQEHGWKRVDDLTSGQVIYIADSENVTDEVIHGWDKRAKKMEDTSKKQSVTT